jgi:hypothetical protein
MLYIFYTYNMSYLSIGRCDNYMYVIQWYKSVSRSKKIYSLTVISQLTYDIYIVLDMYLHIV